MGFDGCDQRRFLRHWKRTGIQLSRPHSKGQMVDYPWFENRRLVSWDARQNSKRTDRREKRRSQSDRFRMTRWLATVQIQDLTYEEKLWTLQVRFVFRHFFIHTLCAIRLSRFLLIPNRSRIHIYLSWWPLFRVDHYDGYESSETANGRTTISVGSACARL